MHHSRRTAHILGLRQLVAGRRGGVGVAGATDDLGRAVT
jgi:hypothetical protein